jgi:effector-binding domain-containing protein
MTSEPRLETHEAQPYVGIRRSVAMQDFPSAIDRTLGELRAWVTEHGLADRAGPPIIRYLAIDMQREMLIDFGIPLTAAVEGDELVHAAELPGGLYAIVVHTGHYDGLREATGRLLDWGGQRGLTWQKDANGDWQARYEQYLTDPSQEPDPSKWETRIAILVAD